jgi:esterase/lipase superfamily enzyme
MAEELEAFFVTNRNIEGDGGPPWFGRRFNAVGPAALRYGRVTGRRNEDGDYEISTVSVAPEVLEPLDNPNRVVGSKLVLDELRAQMTAGGGRDALVLIHGYASTFETSMQRGLQLADAYRPNGKRLAVIVFSWPANGEMVPFMSYHSDRDDARDSGEAMARAMLILKKYIESLTAEERCSRSIHLLAHSMGNYALRWGVQHLRRYFDDKLPRLFDQIVLAAADEDNDAFDHDHKHRLLPGLGRRVSVYFAPQDTALFISDSTKGNPDRLGSDGPKQITGLPTKIVLLDCREVALDGDRWTGHQYYRSSPRAALDIVKTLEGHAPDLVKGRVHIPELRAWRLTRAIPRERR